MVTGWWFPGLMIQLLIFLIILMVFTWWLTLWSVKHVEKHIDLKLESQELIHPWNSTNPSINPDRGTDE
jgi:hypothetical protein